LHEEAQIGRLDRDAALAHPGISFPALELTLEDLGTKTNCDRLLWPGVVGHRRGRIALNALAGRRIALRSRTAVDRPGLRLGGVHRLDAGVPRLSRARPVVAAAAASCTKHRTNPKNPTARVAHVHPNARSVLAVFGLRQTRSPERTISPAADSVR